MPEKSKKDVYKAFLSDCIRVKKMTRMEAVVKMRAKFPSLSVNYLRNLAYQNFPNVAHAGERRVSWSDKPKAKPKVSKPKPKVVKKPNKKVAASQPTTGKDITAATV